MARYTECVINVTECNEKMFKFQIFLVCIIPRVRGLNPDIGSAKFSLTGMGLFMAEIYFAFFRDRLHCVSYF